MRAAALKALGGIGTALVCAASAALVVSDPKPGAAPLRPATGTRRVAAAAPHDPTGGLVISPSCGLGPQPVGRVSSQATLSQAEDNVIARLRAAASAADRRAVLQSLSPDERQQVTAYLASRRGARTCANRSQSSAQVSPDVEAATDTHQPITSSYVS